MHCSPEEYLSFVEKTTPYYELYFELYGTNMVIMGLEGTFGDSLVQPLCLRRVSYSRMH